MMRKAILTFAALAAALALRASGLDSVLASVERNNLGLQALRKDNEAAMIGVRGGNAPGDPSVEYSPFFRNGADGVASSELVVSQGFDFPTLYAARRKSARLRQAALDRQYEVERRGVMLAAAGLCLDFVSLQKKKALAAERLAAAEGLLAVLDRRLGEGDATAMEVNKVKMDCMATRAEAAMAEADLQATVKALEALNGNKPLALAALAYPKVEPMAGGELLRVAVGRSRDVAAAAAGVAAAEQDAKVERQGWIPKIEVGYRRNTDMAEASHGFLVGASFPLFSNRSRVKAARAQRESAELRLREAEAQAEADAARLVAEAEQLRLAVEAYDTGLLRRSLGLLRKAVEGGEMSVADYYAEAGAIYQSLQSQIDAERLYYGKLAELYKDWL